MPFQHCKSLDENLFRRQKTTRKKNPTRTWPFPKKRWHHIIRKPNKKRERKSKTSRRTKVRPERERERKETCLSSCPHGPPSRSWWTCARSLTGVHHTRSCHRKLVLFSPYLDCSCFPRALCPWLSPCVCARARPRMPRTEYTSRIQSLECVVGRRYGGKGTSRGTLSRAYVTRLAVRTLIRSLNRAPVG
jgi:hypothetical protein